MTTAEQLAERLSDEADLCRNDGADDIANLLDEARQAIAALDAENQTLRRLEARVKALEAAMKDTK